MQKIVAATQAWINGTLSYPGVKALRRALTAEAKARGLGYETVLDQAIQECGASSDRERK